MNTLKIDKFSQTGKLQKIKVSQNGNLQKKKIGPSGSLENHNVRKWKSETKVCIVTDEHIFGRMKEEWELLVSESQSPVYTRFDWMYYWWRHFGRHPNRSLYIITIYSDSRLVGIAPFYIGSSVFGPVKLQRRLYLMGCGTDRNECLGFTNDYGYSDFLDVIAHPDYRSLVAERIVELLNNNFMNVDVACFQHSADNSFVICEILPYLNAVQSEFSLEKTDESPFITLPETLEKYIKKTGTSSRRRRFRKNLKVAGKRYDLEWVTNPDQVSDALDQLVVLHGKKWNRLGYPGAFYDRRHYTFVKDVVRAFGREGMLWFLIVRDENGINAARMALYDGHSVYDWLSGLNDQHPSAKYRPGLGMLATFIREAICNNVSTFELLRGSEQYKFAFTSETRPVWRLTIQMNSNSGWRNIALQKLLRASTMIYYRIKRELKLLHIQYFRAGMLMMPFGYTMFRLRKFRKK